MKRLICGTILALFGSVAICQPVPWSMTEVKGPHGDTVGYIYYTNSIGTQVGAKTEKLFTSLRMICSTKGPISPALAIFWDGAKGISHQYVHAFIDGRPIMNNDAWSQDDNIVYRSIDSMDPIMQQLKTGNTVTFTWIDDNAVRRTTAFDLRSMKQGLTDFNANCHTQL